jgi:hypothetical protein
MSQKDERHARFKSGYPNGTLSVDLIECGQVTLERALQDRQREVMRNAHNHYSPNAVGAFILAVSAWEASMNEILAFWNSFGREDHRDRAALAPFPKFLAMTGVAEDDPLATEFRMLTRMRNELAHFLPGGPGIPEDYSPLEARGLFIRSTHGPAVGFQFCQKLSSYALAYWSWTTCHEAVMRAVASTPPVVQSVCDFIPHHFALYRSTCPPERLPEYDKAHGLELTPHRPRAEEPPPSP